MRVSTKWVIAKNAIANLGRGGAAGIAALFLPAVLVRHMSQVEYGVWVLVLQVTAYVGYLDFGLQTAIGRYVAFANEKKDLEQRDSIFSTAFIGLCITGGLGIILLAGAVTASKWLFPNVPAEFLPQMRWALLIVGASMAVGLPISAWSALFVGLQRNEIPAIVIGGSKLISALGLVLAVLRGRSIVTMAVVVAVVNIVSYLAQYLLARIVVPEVTFRRLLVRQSTFRELSGYCLSLTIWSFSMMLVTGLDLVLVARFQFSSLAPYAVAASMVTFVAGMQVAIFSAMMPHAAVLQAQQNPARLGNTVITATRFGVLGLALTGMPLIMYAVPILRVWVGTKYASDGHFLLTLLLVANMIRLSAVPYSVVLVGTGQQRLIIISPLMEGVTNLIASVALGTIFGAIGVAYGTLIGSIVGLFAHVFYNIPRTNGVIRLRVRDYVLSGLGIPALTAIPLLLVGITSWSGSFPTTVVFVSGFSLSALLGATLIFKAGPLIRRSEIQE